MFKRIVKNLKIRMMQHKIKSGSKSKIENWHSTQVARIESTILYFEKHHKNEI